MIFMVEERAERLSQVANYLESYKGEETIRSVAERASVSHSVVGALFARRSLPKAEFLLKIGQALGANILTLMQLAGYLEVSDSRIDAGINDPKVRALAEQLEELPPEVRGIVVEALESQLNAVLTLQQIKEILGDHYDKEGK